MITRAEVRFTGAVQGVNFRAYTQRFALQLGVQGWVENLDDGSVRAVLEGEKDAILELIRQLSEGHPFARVDRVEVTWSVPQGEFHTFIVKRD